MGDPADVPELEEDSAAGLVHGMRDMFPAFDLFGRVDARCPDVPLSHGTDLGRFGNDEAGGRPLFVISRHQGVRDVSLIRPVPGHGGHDGPVG